MKKTLKRLTGCIVTLFLTAVISVRLGVLVRPLDTDDAFNAIETFHGLPEDSVEVIGYGSSRMWRGFDPMEMYEKYGIGAYNYGCNWQSINTTALFLKDSLRTQSPKVVLIETSFVNEVLQDVDMDGQIYYTRGLPEFEGKRQYLRQCFGDDKERWLSYYMPLCAFHDNWVNISQGSFMENADVTDFYGTMGFRKFDNVTPVEVPDPSGFEQCELSPEAYAVLDDIVSVCKEKNIDVIFYTVPVGGDYLYGDAMKRYAKENGCVYFNLFEYMEETGIDGAVDFNDPSHLNGNGSKKLADFLGEYIVSHYDVTDMRTIEDNPWEKNLQ